MRNQRDPELVALAAEHRNDSDLAEALGNTKPEDKDEATDADIDPTTGLAKS